MKRISTRTAILAALLAPASTAIAAAQPPEPKYQETRDLMALVRDAAGLVAAQGVEAACAEFRAEGSRWFGGDRYIFVLGMDGEALCHPARPSLEGQELMELRDPRGKPIVANFVRELESAEDGWVHYHWPRPGSRVFDWKSSYVRRVSGPDGRDLIVGSGRYEMQMERFFVVEQVEDAIELIRERGAAEAFETLHDESSGFLFYSAYVFVLDGSGTLLVNNAFPENEGRDLSELADIDGKKFVREMLAIPAGEAAWVDYKWPKPGDTWPSVKSSYVRNVEIDGQRLFVGSGVYLGLERKDRELPAASGEAASD